MKNSMSVLETVLSETASPNVAYFCNRRMPASFEGDEFYEADGGRGSALENKMAKLNSQMQAIQHRADTQNRPLNAAEISEIETLFAEFKTVEDEHERRKQLDGINARMSESRGRQTAPGAPGAGGMGAMGSAQRRITGRPEQVIPAGSETWIDQATGNEIPVLLPNQKFADITPNRSGITCGAFLRSMIVGGEHGSAIRNELSTSPDAEGGFAVPSFLANEFIDMVRTKMVLNRAGARTIRMPGKVLSLAKITADPSVSFHAENAAITASQPNLGAVVLTARTVTATVKFSLELSQDAPNIEAIIMRSVTSALALAVDRSGLVGDGSANSPTGILHYPGINVVSAGGALASYDKFLDMIGALLSSDVDLESIGPIIIGSRAWKKLAQLKTGIASDLTTLSKPVGLEKFPFLVTTAIESSSGSPLTWASTAFAGDFSQLLFGLRSDVTLKILDQQWYGSNLTLALNIFMRIDWASAHDECFAVLTGITH